MWTKLFSGGIGTLYLITSSLALARDNSGPLKGNTSEYINTRCRVEDALPTNEQALARLEWAYRCNLISKSLYENSKFQVDEGTVVKRDLVMYPSFGYDDAPSHYPLWTPGLDCSIPDNVVWVYQCMAGCFTGDQKILFESGHVAIQSVYDGQTHVDKVVVLDANSEMGRLNFTSDKIGHLIGDPYPQEQEIYTVLTASGKKIRITSNHPMLTGDGRLEPANQLTREDFLIGINGVPDRIVALTVSKETVSVYHLSPESESKENNIIVAQGLLTGSLRVQNDYEKFVNRLLQRTRQQVRASEE